MLITARLYLPCVIHSRRIFSATGSSLANSNRTISPAVKGCNNNFEARMKRKLAVSKSQNQRLIVAGLATESKLMRQKVNWLTNDWICYLTKINGFYPDQQKVFTSVLVNLHILMKKFL